MTDQETAHLVNTIISTWPLGVRGNVWTDVLRPLDADLARAAYLRLRGTADRPPSVARYLDEIATIRRQRRQREQPPELELDAEEYLAPSDPRAIAAFERGLAQGRAELARMKEHT